MSINTFHGRANELRKLDNLYASGKFECVILHGRLRTGKTSLLQQFMHDKSCIYFSAQETSDDENLNSLVRAVMAFPRIPAGEQPLKNYYEEVFERLNKLSRTERLLLVIDEYQYLVGSNKGISEFICRFIEQKFSTGKLMIVICGSSEAVMQSETLDYSAFYGKRTAQIKLEPFTFFEAKRFYSEFSPFDIAVIYGLTSGIPKYLNMMNPFISVEDNIKNTFFNPASELFEEPETFLRREVRDPSYYNAVLKAIATGSNKNSEIATAVGLETSACTAYLKNLISFGLVGKHTPVTERPGKKTIYEIEDSMFRFWYRFVPVNASIINAGTIDKIWRSIAHEIPIFMSTVFEDICRQWVTQRNVENKMPVQFTDVGRWWGYDLVTKEDTYIPIVAYAGDSFALFGDAIWSDTPTDESALRNLEERSRLFRYPERYLYLFSRSGFTDECADLAIRLGANLVMFE
ncbi:MAG: ATP-binding protein [Oscillospiraceae bacterium]|jgi:AAA+ ATPase superfamily predicted ATPase|nr:ATP-binding protein [Oscillospiraceae bacterium]